MQRVHLGYPARAPGMIEPGNIDLRNRQVVQNPDGSFSTEVATTVGFDDHVAVVPQIVKGKNVGFEGAVEHYKKTGEHMGRFKPGADMQAADFANRTHLKQEKRYGRNRILGGDQK